MKRLKSTSIIVLLSLLLAFCVLVILLLVLQSKTWVYKCANGGVPRDGSGPVPLSLPTVLQRMPHLLAKPDALVPRRLIGKGRTGVSVVIGIPTVRRSSAHSYLEETLDSLLRIEDSKLETDVLVIVMAADITNLSAVDAFINDLRQAYAPTIEKGTLEIIAPSPEFYPDLHHIHSALDDSLEHQKWRTKQVLDYAYLMTYAQSKGSNYVQLEDDVVAVPKYLSTIKRFAQTKRNRFIFVQLSGAGFIGKLFRTVDLLPFVEFLLLFYETKPVDWLLTSYVSLHVCPENSAVSACRQAKQRAAPQISPPLFHHIGMHSSFQGKTHDLPQEISSGNVILFIPHKNNPPAQTVWTTMKVYPQHDLEYAYNGSNYFWTGHSQVNDTITVEFRDPTVVTQYLFKSGNAQHPGDRLSDAVVEVATPAGRNQTYTWREVGRCYRGIARGTLTTGAALLAIRIRILSGSEFGIVIKEIWIRTADVKVS
ncbi:alpha-1,3-mannosyl-glycoprotein 4-beta-N-acetylglucosaminyltransferase B-like [Paramacrobiotus metropolitanus]|uniref:alpha-1,3-mannosyl-glycoprotein 4-beta-N-acetylglucosaminyltransferase B-like n=1 Tax=Paramacrobiotus metropolitanus TaxID=2943436 RepID=UPI00244608C8|nr:alpha-1,3-mannosyl-glycoprotein 4-beta-N-acetylglucosaminyltransferase B-like [Paramacrobiotus metropolitanus]